VGVCVRSVVRQYERHVRSIQTATAACAALLAAHALVTPAAAAQARSVVLRPQSNSARTPSPMVLLVSIRKQRIRAFDAAGEVATSRISSGQPGFDTPTGVFSVLEKNEYHESNIYEGAPMPFMQRLTWSGIALHAGVVPGYRASHGCIRLPASFAKSLFDITKIGSRVIVTTDETVPLAFDHPNLFKPLPAETPDDNGAQLTNETTRVAINDTGTNNTGTDAGTNAMMELPLFLGVSPALAEAARDPSAFAPERPRSRAEMDSMSAEKQSKLQTELKAAEALKISAGEKAKVAVRTADEATEKLAAAKVVITTARTSTETADKKLTQARKAFADYMSGGSLPPPPTKSSSKPAEQSEDREAELEDTILDLAIEADSTRNELARREMDFAAIQAVASAAESTRTAALEEVRRNQAQLRFVQTDLIEANKQAVRRNKSISVFISLKTERIYIRQGLEPLLEAPITLANAGRQIGTHVFTAMGYGSNPDAFDWRLVSAHLPASTDGDEETSSRKKRREVSLPPTATNSIKMARAALDVVKIPPDILQTIAELARPGASMIISDRELTANENGVGTEFVVLTR
jgi:L,D-transpeptidase catalytic domain